MKRRHYTTDEDARILAVVEEAVKEGHTQKIAFLMLEEELTDRKASSIESRYKALTYKKNKNNKVLSDTERIIASLKTLNHNNIRNQEKVNMWKSKFEASQKELKIMNEKYSKLYEEHDVLLKTVSDTLGIELGSHQNQVEQIEEGIIN